MSNIYDMADTWNDAGTAFTAIKMNVTDTASDADSLLMDLQVGGSSRFSVSKAGAIGLYNVGTNKPAGLGFGTAQTNALTAYIGGTGLWVSGSSSFVLASDVVFAFSSYARTNPNLMIAGRDTFLARDAAGTLAQRNGANAQTFNIYNTYTDASNYERGHIGWSNDTLHITTQAAGTGIGRNIQIIAGAEKQLRLGGGSESHIYFTPGNQQGFRMDASANFYPSNDNDLDIGLSTNKVRKLYVHALDATSLKMDSLPTSDPVTAGQLWNDAGTLKVSAG